jgi:integrase
MQRSKEVTPNPLDRPLRLTETWRYGWTSKALEQDASQNAGSYWSLSTSTVDQIPSGESLWQHEILPGSQFQPDQDAVPIAAEMTFGDFVECSFVPEHVMKKRSAGRAYFQGILKHVLTPERVDRAFRVDEEMSRVKLKAISGWPYLDAMRLCDVSPDHVQLIIAAALERGYSTQTVTHIRNVIRATFSHAEKGLGISVKNPANHVKMPDIVRKQAHVLNIEQLRQLVAEMRSPEREITLLAILTEMNVAEICGLQWKCVNLSEFRCMIDGEWIPPRTIAVRKQSYRCEFGPVMGCRKRDIRIPDLLASVFRSIKNRKRFTGREDFVVVSRSGTPVNQDNVANRRLKLIGRRLDMPWLSWNVFHRTHLALHSELGRQLYGELDKVLPPELTVSRRSRSMTSSQLVSAAV